MASGTHRVRCDRCNGSSLLQVNGSHVIGLRIPPARGARSDAEIEAMLDAD